MEKHCGCLQRNYDINIAFLGSSLPPKTTADYFIKKKKNSLKANLHKTMKKDLKRALNFFLMIWMPVLKLIHIVLKLGKKKV